MRILLGGTALAISLFLIPSAQALPAAAPSGPAGPVLPPAATGVATAPTTAGVSAALGDLLEDGSLGPAVGAVVIDVATGATVFDLDGDTPRSVASNQKVLTAIAVLSSLGPESRLTTTVAWDPTTSTLTIVGSGDPTLASVSSEGSSMTDLADQVAAEIPAGQDIDLRYDASLFGGPAIAPGWSSDYPALGVAAPVSALLVDRARVPDSDARQEDPALAAATVFAGMLADRGLSVGAPQQGAAVGGVVAETESVPIAVMVETMLTESDNDMSESLAHLAGAELTGTGTFASGAEATLASIRELGFDTTGMSMSDGSGLSYDDVVPPATLAGILALVAGDDAPGWTWPITAGLPIAGLTGTLDDRFLDGETSAAAGIVRAKTGTLFEVSTLAGTLVDADGRLLVFAFLADQTGDIDAARAALDRAVTALVSCGCSG